MPAKPSGEIKTITVNVRQKNGDIYVVERKTLYDPIKKRNNILSSKLISKIPKGSEIPVPTRPKRPKGDKKEEKSKNIKAKRHHTGMMDIVDYVGKISGIDDAIYSATDIGTAQKIISLARYLLATNGQTLPGILTWQYNHPLPYAEGITEDIYHDLFVKVGREESIAQSFFKSRVDSLNEKDALAYDSSTISTYSENQIDARYGFNKADDGLKTIKFLTLYSIESRQPIAYTKQPGNIPDVISVASAISQLDALGTKTREVITDNGYYSEKNFSELLQADFDFITLAKTSIKWIRPELDKSMEALDDFRSMCPYDPQTHGVTVLTSHTFEKVRKYANHKKGAKAGDIETFDRRIYIHIFYNATRQAEDKGTFETDLFDLKTLVESGTPIEDLSESAQSKVRKYFTVRTWGKKTSLIPKDSAIKNARKYHGYFVLVSNKEKDPFEALRKYRKRYTIESYFESWKQKADGSRPRVWNTDTLRGRMLVQFVSLCYYEFLSELIRKAKVEVNRLLNDSSVRVDEKKLLNKLKNWMNETPLYIQLQWFDTVETVEVSSVLKRKRWSTEITQRDILYLKMLGVQDE